MCCRDSHFLSSSRVEHVEYRPVSYCLGNVVDLVSLLASLPFPGPLGDMDSLRGNEFLAT